MLAFGNCTQGLPLLTGVKQGTGVKASKLLGMPGAGTCG
jgi:hypothetical protein